MIIKKESIEVLNKFVSGIGEADRSFIIVVINEEGIPRFTFQAMPGDLFHIAGRVSQLACVDSPMEKKEQQ